MWRWTTFVILVAFYKFTLSQPITDDVNNDRPTRQLDFRECCPCEDHDKIDFEDPMGAGSEGVFTRARDGGDCPCLRDADSSGASSLFFPTAVRAAGSFLKPGDDKEELKPLFNPEVNLASSVLHTLREVTDQEYEEALARDAAKSSMRAVEDIMFGDATPQESANVVTIVVPNPSDEDDDDVMPEASNVKQSRCIHPLTSARSNLGKMRMSSKPSLITYRPRLSKPKSGLWHRNLLDMDSSVGASNINEHILKPDEDKLQLNTNPLSGIARTNVESGLASNDVNDSCDNEKLLKLMSVSRQNRIDDLNLSKSPLLKSIRDKLRLRNLIPETTIDNDDLRPAPSIFQDQATKKSTYFRSNLPFDSLKQNTRPLSVPNLLNLKDVELVPLKDLISKQKFDKKESEINHDVFRNSPFEDNLRDHEGSSSTINEQDISNGDQYTVNNCDDEADFQNVNVKETEIEMPSTEVLENLPVSKNDLAKVVSEDDPSCADVASNSQDLMTDASNAINNIVDDSKAKPLQNENKSLEESFQDTELIKKSKIIEKTPKLKLLDPVSVNKTLTTIKENIAKKLDDLKIIKTSLKNKNMPNQDTMNDNLVNPDLTFTGNEKEDSQNAGMIKTTKTDTDLPSDNSVFITTTKPLPNLPDDRTDNSVTTSTDKFRDNTVAASECSPTKISLQDLQELSDSMLQQENRASKNIEQNKPVNEEIAEPSEQIDRDADWLDSHSSANTQTENVVEPQNIDKFQDKSNERDTCKTDLSLSKIDTDSAASEIVTNTVPESSNSLGSHQPALDVLKKPILDVGNILKLPPLEPLPIIDNLKDKLTSIFDKSNSDEDVIPLEAKPMCDTEDMLNPIMASDASTTNFQLRPPPSKVLPSREGSNFDILGFKPRSSLSSNVPKIDLKPKDFSLQPEKLQSVLDGTRDLFHSAVPKSNLKSSFRDIQNTANTLYNPLNKTPKLNILRERLLDSPMEATNNIHSTLKNTQHAIESGIRHITDNNKLRNPIIGSHSLLDTLSMNHDDINDKLRALHVDFNDRLETMRNELMDRSKLLTNGIRHTKPNLRTPSNISKQNNWRETSNRRKSQKASPSRKPAQQKPVKNNVPPKSTKQNNFKMHGASSVPVPKTVQLPELKSTSAKSPPLTLQKGSSLIPKFGKPLTKEISDGAEQQESIIPSSNKQFRNKFIPKKESKIKVSFSTTPRPFTLKGNNLKSSSPNSGKRRLYDDHNGSPSEVTLSKIPAPIVDYPNRRDKYARLELTDELPRRGSATIEEGSQKASEMVKNRGEYVLQSWPKATESGFLSKVREAVQTRLSKVKSPKTLKQASIEVNDDNEIKTDMARSATENKEIIDRSPMKQNVSYKCKMVCTKD